MNNKPEQFNVEQLKKDLDDLELMLDGVVALSEPNLKNLASSLITDTVSKQVSTSSVENNVYTKPYEQALKNIYAIPEIQTR